MTDQDRDWKGAKCVEIVKDLPWMADIWTSSVPEDIVEAKEVCETCPLRKECFEAAAEYPNTYGVWGGFRFTDGLVNIREVREANRLFGEDYTNRLAHERWRS